MTRLRFIIRSLVHYTPAHLTSAVGIAISTAVLTGALIIGDSVRYSLQEHVRYRLGKTTHLVHAGDRFITTALAHALQADMEVPCAPLLQTRAIAIVDGGRLRENNIQLLGVDSLFDRFALADTVKTRLTGNNVIISPNLAGKLQINSGDLFTLRIQKNSLVPLSAPFVSDEETTVTAKVTVKGIAGIDDLGMFSLQNTQSAPLNVFISMETLNGLLGMEGKANRILVAAGDQLQNSEIEEALGKLWSPLDAGLRLRNVPAANELELYSERVFIEQSISDAFRTITDNKRFIFSYFVNNIRKGIKETPYSFVSSPGQGQMNGNEVQVNEWLAADLGLQEGDSIEMTFYVVGPLRKLEERSVTLTVSEILPMSGSFADPLLMPLIPGLSDAGHCSDWEAGIPIDLERIRDKDEDYWNKWKGTPKAFVQADLARELWQNRFGTCTAIRMGDKDINEDKFTTTFREQLNPSDLGILVSAVRKDALHAAGNGVDFSRLFLGLSSLVLVSALLLTMLLVLLAVQARMSQAATLSALGFSQPLIRKLFILEGMFVSFTGALLGTVLAILYNKVILIMLNRLWYDIVRTSMLEIKINAPTVLTGFLISFLLGGLVIWIALRWKLAGQTADAQKDISRQDRPWLTPAVKLTALITAITSAVTVLFIITGNISKTTGYFAAGLLLLFFVLSLTYLLLSSKEHPGRLVSNIYQLGFRNIRNNRSGSYAIILLFALGTFIIVSTGSNRKDLYARSDDLSSGTGGFMFYATSTVPVLHDLNDSSAAKTYGLEGSCSFVQFFRNEGDDASCLNLNRVSAPVILGADPQLLDGRFTFTTRTPQLSADHPWMSLQDNLPGGVIPAIADQTVIEWGLGLKPGDTLVYRNAYGDTLKLMLIGGLAESVFQGNVIISGNNFLANFPDAGGASVFLIESQSGNDSVVMADFSRAFRDYGWQMAPAADRIAEFYSVQNTYLAIFLLLGIISLILGTAGLGILLARTIMERRSEMGLLLALGYGRIRVSLIIFSEYITLLTAGLIIGFIPAIIATLPSLMSVNTGISVGNLLVILLILLVNSILWIGLFTRSSTGGKVVSHLRYE
jgi:ABC-type lipoprotein release transport system permease subunit